MVARSTVATVAAGLEAVAASLKKKASASKNRDVKYIHNLDAKNMLAIAKLVKAGKWCSAMDKYSIMDTEARDYISVRVHGIMLRESRKCEALIRKKY